MPLIDDASVEAVRQAADLVELLRGRVQLVRRSGRWWGRCPFHDERSPSFTILPDHRNYYCFGCGAKGDAITWMREREGAASFNEAVEALAERFGIELKYAESSPQEEAARAANRKRIEVLQRARDFYAAYLWKADEAAGARAYLAERGFDEDLLRTYHVGYAPGGGSVLSTRALRQGYDRRQLVEAGLARDRGGAPQDFFTSRITFPIANGRDQVQGFGARTLDPNERAKYVNSPEGRNFRKRTLLFALDVARAEAARRNWVMVVEGYTDVLALAKAGYPNAVACMGTSLTSEQLRLLARTADEVRLCFDGDRAGQDAAWRSVEALGDLEVRLTAVPFPAGSDPGDLAAAEDGVATLRGLVEAPQPMLSYLVRARTDRAGATAAERSEAFADIARLLARFPESIERDEALRITASRLEMSGANTQTMLERLAREAGRVAQSSGDATAGRTSPPALVERLAVDEVRERRWLAIAVALGPEVAATYGGELAEEAFDRPDHRAAFREVVAGRPIDDWPRELEPLTVELRVTLTTPPVERELREVTLRLQERVLERRASAARERGDDDGFLRFRGLLSRVRAAIRDVES